MPTSRPLGTRALAKFTPEKVDIRLIDDIKKNWKRLFVMGKGLRAGSYKLELSREKKSLAVLI